MSLASPRQRTGTAGPLSPTSVHGTSGSLHPAKTSSAPTREAPTLVLPAPRLAHRSSPARRLCCLVQSSRPSTNRRLPAPYLMGGLSRLISITGGSTCTKRFRLG